MASKASNAGSGGADGSVYSSRVLLLAGLTLCVLVRLLVGLSSYSGAGDPPKYGDYEAQRHWMELTINLPPALWYSDVPGNEASYWPLDYPPLSGYQSWLYGQVVSRVEPQAVELATSRGYESPSSKRLLRWTVVASDLAVLFPAALAAAQVFSGGSPRRRFAILAALLLQPALLLVDHGHFQYNGISLGLSAAAAAAIAAGRLILGSVLFSLALNHKQMSLFFAPAFFAHLLGRCLQQPTWPGRTGAVLALGVTVLTTFAVLWSPWLHSVAAAQQVLMRIFPLRRGLFEDYVANWWCASSVALKWKELVAQPALVRGCAATTLLAAAPAMAQQLRAPSGRGLLYCMANSAAAFYMFGYQVHEKSILLPLLPISMLAAWEPALALWAPLLACFSMYPLLERDGCAAMYFAVQLLYVALLQPLLVPDAGQERKAAGVRPAPRGVVAVLVARQGALVAAALAGAATLHAARLLVPAPPRYPWLHDRAAVSYSFMFNAVGMLYLNWRQYNQPPPDNKED